MARMPDPKRLMEQSGPISFTETEKAFLLKIINDGYEQFVAKNGVVLNSANQKLSIDDLRAIINTSPLKDWLVKYQIWCWMCFLVYLPNPSPEDKALAKKITRKLEGAKKKKLT